MSDQTQATAQSHSASATAAKIQLDEFIAVASRAALQVLSERQVALNPQPLPPGEAAAAAARRTNHHRNHLRAAVRTDRAIERPPRRVTMPSDSSKPPRCPSAQPGMDDLVIFGVRDSSAGERPVAACRLPDRSLAGHGGCPVPRRASRPRRDLPDGGPVRGRALPALRWHRLQAGRPDRYAPARRGRERTPVRHPIGLPLVETGGQGGLPALPPGDHRTLRSARSHPPSRGSPVSRGPSVVRQSCGVDEPLKRRGVGPWSRPVKLTYSGFTAT